MQAPSGALPATLKEDERHIDISFPSILEQDVAKSVGAIVSAVTLDGSTDAGVLDKRNLRRLLLTALGEDDVDELLDQLDELDQEIADEMAARAAVMPPAPEPQPGPPIQESFVEAVRELREALRSIRDDAA